MRRTLACAVMGVLMMGLAGCDRSRKEPGLENVAASARTVRNGLPEKDKADLASLGHAGDADTLQKEGLVGERAHVVPASLGPAKPAGSRAANGGSAPGAGAVHAEDLDRSARKVVRNAQLLLVASDTREAVKRLTGLAPSLSGYVAGVSSMRDGELMSYTITLKVPAGAFERAVEEAKQIALRVDGETISTEDVTDQFVDLDARFRALRGTERELLLLLSESRARKSKVRDIMEVFEELTSIRTNMEQLQGQMRKLEQVSAFSTLIVVVRPDSLSRPVVTAGWRPSATLHEDLTILAAMGRGLVDLGIGVLVLGLPIALPAALFAWMLYRVVRRLTRTPAPSG